MALLKVEDGPVTPPPKLGTELAVDEATLLSTKASPPEQPREESRLHRVWVPLAPWCSLHATATLAGTTPSLIVRRGCTKRETQGETLWGQTEVWLQAGIALRYVSTSWL
jgi:hypothetical protein